MLRETFSNARIPRQVASSFNPEQLAAIKTAFGGERWDGHPVELRGTIPLLRWYFAFVGALESIVKLVGRGWLTWSSLSLAP